MAEKLCGHYQITPERMRSYLRRSSRMPGNPKDNLARLLELRLENVVYRLGLTRTIHSARRLVREGHVLLNGSRVISPGHPVSQGDTVTFREASHSSRLIPALPLPSYLRKSPDGLSGQVFSEPI